MVFQFILFLLINFSILKFSFNFYIFCSNSRPVHWACMVDAPDILQYLLENGADPNPTSVSFNFIFYKMCFYYFIILFFFC